MAVEEFGVRLLAGQSVEVAVHGVRVAAFRFQLDGQVFDAEVGCDALSDGMEEVAGQGLIVPIDLYMRGHHDEARLDRPDVEVMHVLHAGNGFDGGGDLRGADAGRGGLQKDLK